MPKVNFLVVRIPLLVVDKESAQLETIPPGTIIELQDDGKPGPGMREIQMHGRPLIAFNRDLQERAEPVESETGSKVSQ